LTAPSLLALPLSRVVMQLAAEPAAAQLQDWALDRRIAVGA